MIRRITSGWSVMRVLYLGIGLVIAFQSAVLREWFGMAIGGYFAAMGLFGFGCASGNCNTASRHEKKEAIPTTETDT